MSESQRSSGSGTSATLAILAAAMFVYVIDTTIMNVSISNVVADLNTTVSHVQAAITFYTLTMAAFMLTGGKLGDIWGSRRAFRIGLIIYGAGTTVTALAPNIWFLLIGWSLLEGLGSALIVPAINTLVRTNYSEERRAAAYGTLWGVAAAGAAFGPIVGGWLTTNLSWRIAFAVEAFIVVVVLIGSHRLSDSPSTGPRPRLDIVGVVLSAAALGMLVWGILQTSSLGWDDPLVLAAILGGLLTLAGFIFWVRRQVSRGAPALVHLSIFRHRSLNSGLPVLAIQTFVQAGILFLIPLFAQFKLGLNAFDTGVALLPLSISILVVSSLSPRLGHAIYPRTIIVAGFGLLGIGGWWMSRVLEDATSGSDFAGPLLIIGVAIGLIAGQLPNLILSGADPDEASEAAGLQGTFQNLGMSLGTAIAGSIIVGMALAQIGSKVETSTVIPPDDQATLTELLEGNLDRVDQSDQLDEFIQTASAEVVEELERIEDEAIVTGFRAAIAASGLAAFIGAVASFLLPRRKLAGAVVEEAVRAKVIPKLDLEMIDVSAPETDKSGQEPPGPSPPTV